MHTTMVSASGVFGISVATATLVWLPQKVLLFEVTIMYFLNTMAFLTLLCLAMSAIGFPLFGRKSRARAYNSCWVYR
jgi:hypothetical protein